MSKYGYTTSQFLRLPKEVREAYWRGYRAGIRSASELAQDIEDRKDVPKYRIGDMIMFKCNLRKKMRLRKKRP